MSGCALVHRLSLPGVLLSLLLVAAVPARADERFERPMAIEELNTDLQEKSPSISADGLELYFQSNRLGFERVQYWVWVARRARTSDPFGEPERLVLDAANPDISEDGRTLYAARDSSPEGELDIDLYRCERPDRESPFGPPIPIDELNTPYKDGSPTVTADELTVFFHSDRPGSVGRTDLWMARRPSRHVPFDPPLPVGGVNTEFQEMTPSVTPDGLALYFASDRPGGAGALDIWVARRRETGEPFGPAHNLACVNTDGTEKACDISSDGLTLYLRTKHDTDPGKSQLAVAYDSHSGTVNRRAGAGAGVDVLFVNGSAGGNRRRLRLSPTEPFSIRMEVSPAGPERARYSLYAFRLLRGRRFALQPFDLGVTAFPTPLDGGTPRPVVVANLLRGPGLPASKLGDPLLELPPAPGVILDRPDGLGRHHPFVVQGFLEDRGSRGRLPLAITNAIEIVVE